MEINTLKKQAVILFISALCAIQTYALSGADTSTQYRYRWLIKPAYEHAEPFSEGLAAVTFYDGRGNRKHFYIDTLGNPVINHKYFIALPFSEGVAVVEDYDLKRGMIDKEGNVVIPIQYDALGSFDRGLAYFRQGNTRGFLDHTGKHHFAGTTWHYRPFEGDLAIAYRTETEDLDDDDGEEIRYWTYLKRDGTFLFDEIQADQVSDFFAHGLAAAMRNGRVGFIDRQGCWVIEPLYPYAFPFHEGLAMVVTETGCGFIDTTGKMVIEPRFERALSFSEGLAMAIEDDLIGYIDKKGAWVIPPVYEDGKSFEHGLAWVTPADGRKSGLIDQEGKWVFPPVSLYEEPVNDGIAVVYVDGKWGYIRIEPVP